MCLYDFCWYQSFGTLSNLKNSVFSSFNKTDGVINFYQKKKLHGSSAWTLVKKNYIMLHIQFINFVFDLFILIVHYVFSGGRCKSSDYIFTRVALPLQYNSILISYSLFLSKIVYNIRISKLINNLWFDGL